MAYSGSLNQIFDSLSSVARDILNGFRRHKLCAQKS